MYPLLRRFALIPHHRVRWTLILLIGLVATVLAVLQRGTQTSYATYDRMVAKRLWAPTPDPKIVVVDIDEASLDQLKKEFGRWPWPRETLAGALEWLESQKASAVVFDILFSDADPLNAASDEAFAEAVAQSRRSYFPILRLNPANDGLSEVRADQLKGFAERITGPSAAPADAPAPTIAVVPPVFKTIIDSTRLGYHNIFPGADGINRHYDLWLEKDGWRLWSLPARIARDMGWPMPEQPRHLIRFNGASAGYTTVPFHEVWRLSQSSAGRKPDARFDGAVVLIGSTASSLFDVKATPLSPIHPGVHMLANAIDNLKHGRFINELPWWLYLCFAWLALLLMGWASTRMREATLNLSVLTIPGLMLAISFASLHVGPWFIDLGDSASHALTFFSAMSVYQKLRARHFAQFDQAARLVHLPAGGAAHQACLVLRYGPGRVDLQRLIDATRTPDASCAVVQTLWSGERTDLQACPAVVQITAATLAQVHAAADAIRSREAPFASADYLSTPRDIRAGAEGDASYNSDEVWMIVSQAVSAWSAHRAA
jgi:adenylate cyclase